MLSKGVLGLPDQGVHLQLEQETRGVERRLAAWAPLGRRMRGSARRTCLSPHKHALSVGHGTMARSSNTIITEFFERPVPAIFGIPVCGTSQSDVDFPPHC
jgi:hypothetical protein